MYNVLTNTTMKRFFIISIALLALCTQSKACGYGGSSHNSYLFSVIHRNLFAGGTFDDQMNAFWKSYTNGAVDQYHWNEEEILEFAKKKGDTEMTNYLTQLNTYLAICTQLRDTWSYPTKAELAQRKKDLNNMILKANSYKGTRLKAQWSLLAMRARMVLGQHTQNINYWNQTASKLPQSVYRDMAKNIYAGALLHVGRRSEACDIYAEQGDLVSVKWAMRKHRNLAGIKTIMAENPKSPAISFLVQDFVNNTQETIDNHGDKEACDWIDSRIILRNEAMNFISYAREVVDSKKTDTPALWLAAIGELQYLFGMNNEAMATLNQAVEAKGTPRMVDNARAIRMVVSTQASKIDKTYSQWMTNELKWLAGKINVPSPKVGLYDNKYDNHYIDVLERLVYNNLAPKYEEAGQPETAALLIHMTENGFMVEDHDFYEGASDWNSNYSSEFFNILHEKNSSKLKATYENIKAPSSDPLKNYAQQFLKADDNYFLDLIGTKLLSEGKFTEALQYFDKIPANFYEKLNISYYMKHRDFTKARWLEHQVDKNNGSTDGAHLATITSNKKAEFCREMNDLLQRYTLSNNQTRPQIAYDLAKRYYQASYWGDCWWLTEYGHSVYDSAHVDRPDFVKIALDYLQESKLSTDATLHLNSLYALAFIPQDPWANLDYDYDKGKYIYIPRRNARQYNAMADLNNYASQHSTSMPAYVSKCDVLKQFRTFN